MSHRAVLALLCALGLIPIRAAARTYSVERTTEAGVEVIRLHDSAHAAQVSVIPALGNRAVEFSVHGKNILFIPSQNVAAEAAKPSFSGMPFLAPWGNRLDEGGFWANGQHYKLNPDLKNYRPDGNQLPIHGLLSSSNLWQVVEAKADDHSAYVTSRLQFWKYPELMAQWPFAHEYEITYILSNGQLEVRTTVKNIGAEAMPVVLGFHPYYRLPDYPRDEWTLDTPSSFAVETDAHLIPTGQTHPANLPQPFPMKGNQLDNGYTKLARDAQGRAHFTLQSHGESIEVVFGPKYPVAILYEPPPHGDFHPEFLCIEPMAGVTDAVNLNHRGAYPDLQTVAPGDIWSESFWITPRGL